MLLRIFLSWNNASFLPPDFKSYYKTFIYSIFNQVYNVSNFIRNVFIAVLIIRDIECDILNDFFLFYLLWAFKKLFKHFKLRDAHVFNFA